MDFAAKERMYIMKKKLMKILVVAVAVVMVFGVASTAMAVTETHAYSATFGTSTVTNRVFSTTGSMYSWFVRDRNSSISDGTARKIHHVSVVVKANSALTEIGQKTTVESGAERTLPFNTGMANTMSIRVKFLRGNASGSTTSKGTILATW